MLKKRYNNFIKASTSETISKQPSLSGEQAREIYLKEIRDAKNSTSSAVTYLTPKHTTAKLVQNTEDISNKDLFMIVQSNDVQMLKNILDSCPRLLNTVDEFGWSLLMIACQANSRDAVKELLKRGVDTSIRDKGGNSATNLVIRNRNLELADLLISHRKSASESSYNHELPRKIRLRKVKDKLKESYVCEICNKKFPDKDEHLASTVHNINASKDKKIPTNYMIPQTNRGYQIMLKVGWDKECGLGKDGSGKKYPIKAVQKIDRKGLGLEKKKKEETSKVAILKNSKLVVREFVNYDKRMEINFRREFY